MNGKIVGASVIAIGLILSACDASKKQQPDPSHEKSETSVVKIEKAEVFTVFKYSGTGGKNCFAFL